MFAFPAECRFNSNVHLPLTSKWKTVCISYPFQTLRCCVVIHKRELPLHSFGYFSSYFRLPFSSYTSLSLLFCRESDGIKVLISSKSPVCYWDASELLPRRVINLVYHSAPSSHSNHRMPPLIAFALSPALPPANSRL